MNWKQLFLLGLVWSCQQKSQEQPQEAIGKTAVENIQSIESSRLTFPLDFPINELTNLINESLPDVLLNDTLQLKKEGEYLTIKIEPIGDMLLASYADNLDASIPMKITAEIEKKVLGIKVHKPIEFLVRVDMHTQLSIAENWNLSSHCKIQQIHWIEPPVIELLGIKVNLEKKIEKKLLEKAGVIENKVCTAVQSLVPLRQQVEKIWTILSEPHRIGKKPIDIWLSGNPSFFSAHFSKEVNDTLRVIIHTESEIFITPLEGMEYQEKPMPSNSFTPTDSDNELDIKVDVYLPYDQINKLLKSKFDSTAFSFEGASIITANFLADTKNGKLHLKFDVLGSFNATIDAYAYPILDEEKNLIIDSIDYDINSENSFVHLANWVASDRLTEFLKSNATIPLSHILDSLDFKIVKALNKSKIGRKVDLNIAFSKLESDTLIFTDDGLQWLFDVDGNAHAYLTDEIVNN
ncbi:protein of unknown function [Ekhidna lutea]|uniref:DUF4403 family protein n=1 Tax=Ekhidna lutea TaxID=447679 RepID=A0A239F3M5_EKHLU|nr:DUF4403 family protein [Ekhidna lutea]SNS51437.1 protein of unknown function [Ekhidna lutea]